MKNAIYLFIAFLLLRPFLHGTPLFAYYIIALTAPLIHFAVKKDYHLFAFDYKDTIQSVVLNIAISSVLAVILLVFGMGTRNFNWVAIGTMNLPLIFVSSFLQEMLFRYFLEGNLNRTLTAPFSILITSAVSAFVVSPPLLMGIVYFVMGICIGWIFEQTKDIYGATIGHFILYLFALVMI